MSVRATGSSGLDSGRICFLAHFCSQQQLAGLVSWQLKSRDSSFSCSSHARTVRNLTALIRASKRVCPRQKSQPFCNLFSGVTSHHFTIFCSLETNQQTSTPTLKDREVHKDIDTRREWLIWEISYRLPTSICISWELVRNTGLQNQ